MRDYGRGEKMGTLCNGEKEKERAGKSRKGKRNKKNSLNSMLLKGVLGRGGVWKGADRGGGQSAERSSKTRGARGGRTY